MNVREFARKLSNRSLTRRQVSEVLAGAGIGLAVMPLVPNNARAQPGITVFEWSGYELPQFHPEYAAQYGGEPQY